MKWIKWILTFIFFLSMTGCKMHRHIVQTKDDVISTDSVSVVDKKITIEHIVESYSISTDSTYDNFERTIRIYDTSKEGNPVIMEVTESHSNGSVKKEESTGTEQFVVNDSICEMVDYHQQEESHSFVEEEKETDTKGTPWICFFSIVLGASAFAYVCKRILKI